MAGVDLSRRSVMTGSRIAFVIGLLVLAATTALPSAAAEATVDPDPSPPPIPDETPPPNVGATLVWTFEWGGQALGWTFAQGAEVLLEAFEVGGCTLGNVFGNCPYVAVVDETPSTYYASVSKYPSETGVWEESNGCDGLQREAVDCDGDGEAEPADDRLA